VTSTTIKVPAELRDRINRDASDRGLTAAGLIAELIDDYERAQRFTAFGRAFSAADDAYRREVELWDSVSGDGLPGE
jgi:hypothetical protein